MDVIKCRLGTMLTLFVLCTVLSGCAAKSARIHPDAMAGSGKIKKVASVSPDIKVYEISAGGTHELRDDWSAQGKENVTKALALHFKGMPVRIVELKADRTNSQEFKEIMALFEVVSASIINHTYNEGQNQNIFPEKLQNFDYSLGSFETFLSPSEGDALLLISGVDRIATTGKKALNVLGAVTGIAVGALTGVVIIPGMENTTLRMVLVDRNGTILWYNIKAGIYDLRDPSSCKEMVDATLEDFPGSGK